MHDQSKRTPIIYGLQNVVGKEIDNAYENLGKSLPCSVVAVRHTDDTHIVPIVTVKVEIESSFTIPHLTMPLIGAEYIRYPIRVGDKGFAISSDTHLGNMSGLGGSLVNFTRPGNLSAMVFLPIGNAKWDAFDPESLVLYSVATGAIITISPTLITLKSGTCTITLKSDGTMNIQDGAHHTSPTVMHDNFAALVSWLNSHTHTSSGAGVPSSPFTGANIAP